MFSKKTLLILSREFNIRVRKRSFILATLLTPLLLITVSLVPSIMMSKSADFAESNILVIDNTSQIFDRMGSQALYFERADNLESAKGRLAKDNFQGVVVIDSAAIDNPSLVSLYSPKVMGAIVDRELRNSIGAAIESARIDRYDIPELRQIMDSVKTRVSITNYTIDDASDKQSGSGVLSVFAYVGSFMIYIFIFMYGTFVMQSVIEEKNNRIVEVIISSVKPSELMLGKILGTAVVGLFQIAIWTVLIIIGVSAFSVSSVVGELSDASGIAASGLSVSNVAAMVGGLPDAHTVLMFMIIFALYFIGGFLFYASLFAAIGSAVDTPQEAQQFTMPVTLPIIFAFIITMSSSLIPDNELLVWLSFIPLTSPVAMISRVVYGVDVLEVVLSLVLLYGGIVFAIWGAGRIYRVGILMHGKRTSWRDLGKWWRS